MRQCTISPQKRRRTQEALIREGDKSDAALCIKLWKRCRRTTPDLSIREFAKRIGEEESTVRNILNKGTTAGRLTYWLPDQKKRGYFDLSPAFAAEETRRRASNKGPRGKISNHFMRDFAKEYAEKKSVSYALKALREAPHTYHIPSRSARTLSNVPSVEPSSTKTTSSRASLPTPAASTARTNASTHGASLKQGTTNDNSTFPSAIKSTLPFTYLI